jgi:hypothetical protein
MSNNIFKYLTNLGVKLKLIKNPKPIEVKVTIQQSTIDDLKNLHNVDAEAELTEVIKNEIGGQTKNELNQITVKMAILNDITPTEVTQPVKKKRTYKKKTNKPADKPKESAPKKIEKNVSTKTTNRKPPKKDTPV